MSNELIRAMFKHLIGTYTVDETKTILSAKFPVSKDMIDAMSPDDFVEEVRVQEAKKVRVEASKKEKVVKPKVSKTTKSAENKEKSMEIYKKSLDKTRKEVIELIINELGVTPSTGSNLYHWCKREMK